MRTGGGLRAGIARRWFAALAIGTSCVPSPALADDERLDLRVEASVAYDNNVPRSRGADNRLADTIYGLSATKGYVVPIDTNWRMLISGSAALEAFQRYSGLSHFLVGVQGELQHRPSADFAAPTLSLFARSAADFYDSNLRDGYRYSAGVRLLQPLTDRIDLFASVAYNMRDGRSRVFDNRDSSVRVQLDYALGRRDALYAGAEYRYGHTVSTARPELSFVDIAEAIVVDDAFTDGRAAYRFKARTWIGILGYSYGLESDQSLDFSVTAVRSTAVARPTYAGAGTVRYYDSQASIAYLIRF